MGRKDVAEKTLEAYNDVFADIVNVLVFGGEQMISPEDLEDGVPFSQYKADGELHEQERDVAKYWKNDLLRLAFFGFENQSVQDGDMALRVMGYDGAAYRAQLLADERVVEDGRTRVIKKPRYPVFTFVLYFGTKRRWRARTLQERLDVPVPEKLEAYFHDYGINLFEIAWLTDEQVKLFKSDFGIVADYFVQLRKNQNYVPPERTIRHVHELLQLLSVMRNDHRFEETYHEEMEQEDTNMCEVLDKIETRGEVKMLAKLVADKLLTLEQAAERMSVTPDAFVEMCREYHFSLQVRQ